jgi:hypothetical protein
VRRTWGRFLLVHLCLLTGGCKSKRDVPTETVPVVPADALSIDAPPPWPELAGLRRTEPVRVVALPTKPDQPRFDVGGPVIAGDVAVVASSQFGFVAVDWRRGAIAWSKPAGLHVAPPIALTRSSVGLIGDCTNPPDATDRLLGCLRVVTAAGADEAYIAIHGKAVDAFAAAYGSQQVWRDGERTLRWRRGDAAVTIDVVTGVATPAASTAPPLVVAYRDHRWDISHEDGAIVAREHGRVAWRTEHPYTALLGAVYLPEQSPMLRVANVGAFGGRAEMNLLDIDATGSLHGQAAFPVPAIGLLGSAISDVGDVAIAVRLDRSIQRDFIVGYAANALMMWVYPLPVVPRADPVGIAIAPDAVVAFHDGDTLTILPELSAPPTAPGAVRASSKNPTP